MSQINVISRTDTQKRITIRTKEPEPYTSPIAQISFTVEIIHGKQKYSFRINYKYSSIVAQEENNLNHTLLLLYK